MNPLFLQALQNSDQEGLKDFSKLIAMIVRNEMEDFHVAHLSDKQMAELNPLVRKGIYNALFALANYDTDKYFAEFIHHHGSAIPKYWEDLELLPKFKLIIENWYE